jgi:hypothetical protein
LFGKKNDLWLQQLSHLPVKEEIRAPQNISDCRQTQISFKKSTEATIIQRKERFKYQHEF